MLHVARLKARKVTISKNTAETYIKLNNETKQMQNLIIKYQFESLSNKLNYRIISNGRATPQNQSFNKVQK